MKNSVILPCNGSINIWANRGKKVRKMQNNQTIISKQEIKETIASLKQTGVVVKCTENKPFSKIFCAYRNSQKEPYFTIRFWILVDFTVFIGKGFDLSYNGKKHTIRTKDRTYNIAGKLFDVCECMADGDLKQANRIMFPYVVQSKCRMFFNKITHQR